MTEETITALRAYDMLIRHRGLDDVELHWESGTLVCGGGGFDIEILCDPDFGPGPLPAPDPTPRCTVLAAMAPLPFSSTSPVEENDDKSPPAGYRPVIGFRVPSPDAL